MRFAFPRLPDTAALLLLREVRERAASDPASISDMVASQHDAGSPVPTGATIASPHHVEEVRERVLEALNWTPGHRIVSAELGSFDRTLGRALHEQLAILPADAAHKETWNFLSAVVFPDLVWARFPDLHDNRFLGHPRNALRRVWQRQEVLGDLMLARPEIALREDELVGLLERTALVRNRRLARELARCVIDRGAGGARTEWARGFFKRLTHLTGPLMLDVLSDQELESLVADVVKGGQWLQPALEAADRQVESTVSRDVADIDVPRTKDSGDLVLSLNEAVMATLLEVESTLGEAPAELYERLRGDGGLAVVREVAGAADESTLFRNMAEAKRLDSTFEALAVSEEYRGLFSRELVETATARLIDAGWFD